MSKFYSIRSPWADDIEVKVHSSPDSSRHLVYSAQGTDDIKLFCECLEKKGYKFYGYSEDRMSTSEKPSFLRGK